AFPGAGFAESGALLFGFLSSWSARLRYFCSSSVSLLPAFDLSYNSLTRLRSNVSSPFETPATAIHRTISAQLTAMALKPLFIWVRFRVSVQSLQARLAKGGGRAALCRRR